MLRMRQEQIREFDNAAFGNFMRRAVEHLRRELPECVSARTDEDLAIWVREAVFRGEAHLLRTERQIMCLLDSEVLLGPRFYEDPRHAWALALLCDAGVDPNEKGEGLLARACSLLG